jgi:hypothetical protein
MQEAEQLAEFDSVGSTASQKYLKLGYVGTLAEAPALSPLLGQRPVCHPDRRLPEWRDRDPSPGRMLRAMHEFKLRGRPPHPRLRAADDARSLHFGRDDGLGLRTLQARPQSIGTLRSKASRP